MTSNYLQKRELARLELRPDLIGTHTFVPQPLEHEFRLGTWLLGAGMIVLGIMNVWQRPAAQAVKSGAAAGNRRRARATG